MMRLISLLLLLAAPQEGGDLDARAELAKTLIEQRVANRWNPGIVAGLVDGDQTRVVAAGRRGAGDPRPLDGQAIFEIGSVSKVFTGILLAEAVERKEVRLEQPVTELLPDAIREKWSGDKAKITLRMLSQHLSGLPRMPSNFKPKQADNPYADYTVEQMYEYLGSCTLNHAPDEQYEYSNLAQGLLGHVLSQKAGGDYETLLVRRICGPLKMDRTRVAFTPGMRAQLARGHSAAGFETANWDLPTLAGAGGIRSNVDDLLLFAKANLSLPEIPLAAAMRRAQSERHRINPTLEMGLGWHVVRASGREFLTHGGETGGYHAFISLDVKNRRGVVMLTNAAMSIDDIGQHLMDPGSPLDAARQKPRDGANHQTVTLEAKQLESLVGVYELAPTFSITVSVEGGRLMARATGQDRFEIFPESDTRFFYKVVDAQITFERGPDGKATGMMLHQNGQNLPGKKK
jgi:CubicO group peptidase (beta-lactamase class C family)